MKKTRLLKALVIICIILSSLSFVFAKETSQFDVGDNNATYVEETKDQLTTIITANASFSDNDNGAISFKSLSTGVFTINVQGISRYNGKDICYVLKDSSGNVVRLAALYDEQADKYTTISTANTTSSKVDVLLKNGETYTLSLSQIKTLPTEDPERDECETYITDEIGNAEYSVTLTANTSVYQEGTVVQSNIPSNRITEGAGAQELPMEELHEDYRMPDDVGATLRQETIGQAIAGAAGVAGSIAKEYIVNPFEDTVCDVLLFLGDQVVNLLNYIIGEEVTVTALVYNQIDAVNPNFFDSSVRATGITANVTEIISEWYDVFKLTAISVYLVALLAIGINILLASTGKGLQKGRELFVNWLKGLIYLVFVPYLIKYAFIVNETLVQMLADVSNSPDYKVGGAFGHTTEWSAEEIEFRSPEYVSKYTGKAEFGSDQANKSYINKVSSYEQNLDLMRIMRAYAGVTKKFIYCIIWWILIGQLLAFIVQYYKRFFIIAFLIGSFPIVCIFHAINVARGLNGREIGSWLKEIFTNIFIQLVQAIIYTVITGICVSIVKEDIRSSATMNWILIILAINFVSEGEKILRKIMGALADSAGGTGKAGQGVKGAYRRAKSNVQRFLTGTSDEDKK